MRCTRTRLPRPGTMISATPPITKGCACCWPRSMPIRRMGPAAEASATGTITGALAGRLVTQAGWNAHPAYATERIERPLIVIGLPRTGTTALHQLLSMDPQFQGFERWLTANPMVRPPRETWDAHPVYRASVERIAAMQPARARDHGRPFDRGGRGRRMPDADGAELRVQLVRLEHRRARL